MFDRRFGSLAAAIYLLAFAPTHSALAEDDGDVDEGGERCIDTRRLSHTEIIDKQNMLFHMKNRTIYHNELRYKCPSLRPGKIISFRGSFTRVCRSDAITVLENYGTGLSPAGSCSLGTFRPISKEEAQALKGVPDIKPVAVPPAEPEEPEVSE